MSKLAIIFGWGYVAQYLAPVLLANGFEVVSTSRKVPVGQSVKQEGIGLYAFDDPALANLIEQADVLLSTIAPSHESQDPVWSAYADVLNARAFSWVGYLSSTAVYGDHQGAWVDEQSACLQPDAKAKARLAAEAQWQKIGGHVFRLAGIYGPGQNALVRIQNGKDTTLVKPHQFFSRIHVADIAQALMASISYPTPKALYNVCDDEPVPLYIVEQFAAGLLGKTLQEIPYEAKRVSAGMTRFFSSNKKVSSAWIKKTLNLNWQYPTYREGLQSGCMNEAGEIL